MPLTTGMLAAIAALTLLAQPAAAQSDTQEDQRAFLQSVLPDLRDALPGATITPSADDPLAVEVDNYQDWEDATLNLHRIYYFCLDNAGDPCTAALATYITNLTADLPDFEAANLRIIVRDVQYVGYLAENIAGEEWIDPIPMGGNLFALLAVDSPTAIGIATLPMLADAALSPEDAWQRAESNTLAVLPPVPTFEEMDGGIHAYVEMEYLPSMLFPTSAWQALADAIGPDLWVAAIASDFVVTGVTPDAGMAELSALVRDSCRSVERCISQEVYRFREGRWEIARPGPK